MGDAQDARSAMQLANRLREFFQRRPGSVAPERQAGAIPYALVEGRVAFLLITSRRTGRWIFPKGALMPGLSLPDVAAREAREEAGVSGAVETASIGSYRDWKTKNLRRMPIEVAMFPLRVDEQHEEWREAGQRHRHWAILAEARRLLGNPQLVDMIAEIDRRAGGR